MTRAFIIDTDTASDDAVALIMALRWPDVEVKAITMVAGNVGLEQATRNALYTVSLTGKNVPVYMGASKPLTRRHENAQWFHGQDGLGDQGYPEPTQKAESKPASCTDIGECRDLLAFKQQNTTGKIFYNCFVICNIIILGYL